MSDEYTPTTTEVRQVYGYYEMRPEEFDRWLKAHDAEVWDQGALDATYSVSATHHYAKNPYRNEGER